VLAATFSLAGQEREQTDLELICALAAEFQRLDRLAGPIVMEAPVSFDPAETGFLGGNCGTEHASFPSRFLGESRFGLGRRRVVGMRAGRDDLTALAMTAGCLPSVPVHVG